MSGFKIFTLAFAGKMVATIFLAVCIAYGFGPDTWIAFLLGPTVAPWIARLAFILLAVISGAVFFFSLHDKKTPVINFPNNADRRLRELRGIVTAKPEPTVGSLEWRYSKCVSLEDAAKIAYGETRKSIAAEFAEMGDAGADEIVSWYAYAITGCVDVYGTRPPSNKYERLNLKDASLKKSTLNFTSPIHNSAYYDDLIIEKEELAKAIAEIKNWGSDIVRLRKTPDELRTKTKYPWSKV